MKRLSSLTLALLMTVMLLGVATPVHAEEDAFVGLWEMTGQQEGGVYTAYAEAGLLGYMDFLPSGAIYCVMTDGQDTNEAYMAYQVADENALELFEGERRPTGAYDPATGVLTVTEPESGFELYLERVTADPLPDVRAMVDRAETERKFYGYLMSEGDESKNMLEFLSANGMDPRDFYLTLRPDGTGYLQFGDADAGSEFTWTETELIADGDAAPYTWVADHILLAVAEDASLEFAPEGEVEALLNRMGDSVVPVTVTAVDVEPEELAGEWKLTMVGYGSTTIPIDQIQEEGVDMSFTFSADGTASMTSNGTTTDSISWAEEDGVVILSSYGYDLFKLQYDGQYLVLSIGGDFYFEKIG